ncbi:MAG: aldo/keto reductase [Bacteroidetes bacterium]|nr:MAG: aldo/keto reductase [Bacteroidota bacterium]
MTDINFKPSMEYRRFGKTEKILSVITLGGMRFKHGWQVPRHKIPKDTLDQCIDVVQLALDAGINHIETAWGYRKSETAYGKVLNEELKIPRSFYNLMTKGHVFTASEMRKMVENQLRDLQTSYLDFYGWHGINNDEIFQQACKTGGAVEELQKMKEEGIIRHVGFSTHAPLNTIIAAIETGMFEFVNLHYYYFNQRNEKAVEAAKNRDMGVFIISPNDKGGQLFYAPQKVRQATHTLTPIQWNSRFCLKNPGIHTLSFGMTEAAHFAEMKGIFPSTWTEKEELIKLKLDSFLQDDPYSGFHGYELANDPSGINIPEVLRLRKLWKCYDMSGFGKYRYNSFEGKGHWLPGVMASKENIEKVDYSKIPANIPLKKMLAETHREFYVPPTLKASVFKLIKQGKLKLKSLSKAKF